MKNLIRKLSKVSDSSSYSLLRSSESGTTGNTRRTLSFRKFTSGGGGGGGVPEGHVPVYVGEEMERFIVSADLLNHPVFVKLLNKSAQEYGYEQKGVLRIPCHVYLFERVLEALRVGADARELQELVNALSDS